MPKILIADSYYPAALAAFRWTGTRYAEMLRELLDWSFGTSDFVSESLRLRGWGSVDVVANAEQLQRAWQIEHGLATATDILTAHEVALEQVRQFRPDVLFLQDVSLFSPSELDGLRRDGVRRVVAQVSCPMPPEANLKALDLVFTSFPHYHAREFPRMGVRSRFHRLAFSPMASARTGDNAPDRDIPVSFVGGLGGGDHGRGWWDKGTRALLALARARGDLLWRGYGRENVPASEPLAARYGGMAWGTEVYRTYLRSRIVVNRHGEVAEGSGNNLRQYEATG